MIVAGIGSRKGVDASEIVALIERALNLVDLRRSDLTALATADAKADEPGIAAAASSFGLKLLRVSLPNMRDADMAPAKSSRAAQLFGASSVSEVAALAAAGAGSELILPRIKSTRATCALARSRVGVAP